MPEDPIWEPDLESLAETNLTAFQTFVNDKYLLNHSTYNELHAWSVSSPIDFWKAIIEFNEIIYQGSLEPSSEDGMKMPGTRWFPNMKLNLLDQ